MMNELMTYNYIITLLEAAKRAAKKLKRKRKRKLMEAFYGKHIMENTTEFNPKKYIAEVARTVTNLLGLKSYDDVKTKLFELIDKKSEVLKREHIYRLAPIINVMRELIEKCNSTQNPPFEKETCEDIKKKFSEFISQYEAMKEDTPFYKKWYYWFMTQPLWKKILIVIGLIALFFVLVLIITKAVPKAYKLVKASLMGDKEAIKKANDLIKNADGKTKAKAYKTTFGLMTEEALLI